MDPSEVLNFLYLSGDTQSSKPVYHNVDPLLHAYLNADTFASLTSALVALTSVSAVTVQRENPDEVQQALALALNADTTGLGSYKAPAALSGGGATNASDELRVLVQRGGPFPARDLLSVIANERLPDVLNIDRDPDRALSAYTRGLVGALSAMSYDQALVRMQQQTSSSSSSSSLTDAIRALTAGSSTSQRLLVRAAADQAVSKALDQTMVKRGKPLKDVLASMSGESSGGVNGATFGSPAYYVLRTRAIELMAFPPGSLPLASTATEASVIARRLVVDLYIRACFLMLHVDALDGMESQYIKAGRFVEMRMVRLARVFFLYNLLALLKRQALDGMPASERAPYYTRAVGNAMNTLQSYLVAQNDLKSSTQGGNGLMNIIRAAGKTGVDAERSARELDRERAAAQQVQQALRSTSATEASSEAALRKARTGFAWTAGMAVLIPIVGAAAVAAGAPSRHFSTAAVAALLVGALTAGTVVLVASSHA
jgi:hypothetical protein